MLSSKLRSLSPYTAGEQPGGGYIKLNTNENPYPPSPEVLAALQDFDVKKLRLYPDPDSKALTRAIAAYEKVQPENIFLGNGSDEILGFAFLALFEKSAAFADVTYSFYPVYCDLHGLEKKLVPLKGDFTADLSAYKAAGAGGIVLCNPNAPTSLGIGADAILRLVSSVGCNVLLDEAYIDFARGTGSLAPRAPQYGNLLVVKTFSKSYSLAGLRCGYAVGSRELVDGLNRVKNCFNSYTLDALCQTAALAAVTDRAYITAATEKVVATRASAIKALRAAGHTVFDSESNFLFVRHKSVTGLDAHRRLKENGILVRHFQAERTAPFVRVTVGTDADTERFIEEFNKL